MDAAVAAAEAELKAFKMRIHTEEETLRQLILAERMGLAAEREALAQACSPPSLSSPSPSLSSSPSPHLQGHAASQEWAPHVADVRARLIQSVHAIDSLQAMHSPLPPSRLSSSTNHHPYI